MRLDLFDNSDFSRGASRPVELAWIVVSGLLVESWIPGSSWRRVVLRAFGAKIGQGVVLKPKISIKFPWRLEIGDHAWIGERVWIDNLATVVVGPHSCLSQDVYLCTGSHDWRDPRFRLITRPITIGAGCWVGARASIAPGVVMADGAVAPMRSLVRGHLAGDSVHLADGSVKPRLEARPGA